MGLSYILVGHIISVFISVTGLVYEVEANHSCMPVSPHKNRAEIISISVRKAVLN